MTFLGIGFLAPWFLFGLVALPILWVLLRATPPAPVRRVFPGIGLLFGLQDERVEPDKTPWWLLLLRMIALAAVIFALAGPILNPDQLARSERPLLLLADRSWSEASDWGERQQALQDKLTQARLEGRQVAFLDLSVSSDDKITFGDASLLMDEISALSPRAWQPSLTNALAGLPAETDAFDTFWLASPLVWDGQARLAQELQSYGAVEVFTRMNPIYGLRPMALQDGVIILTAVRADALGDIEISANAIGTAPDGSRQQLELVAFDFADGETVATTQLDVPAEIRNRVELLKIVDAQNAGAVTLAGNALQRREVAVIAAEGDGQELMKLLSAQHYLRQALSPSSELLQGAISQIVQANPDVIILADIPRVADPEPVLEWVAQGGVLLRFAGPRLAAAQISNGDSEPDPLLPVRLRAGGRSLGGAMSWGSPKTLQPFAPETLFHGLPTPDEVRVSAQVLAQPGPDLAQSVLASLDDGTPLVTRKNHGAGSIILVHVTANAEWSTLPLSGLFLSMLDRMINSGGRGALGAEIDPAALYELEQALDGYGQLITSQTGTPITGADLQATPLGVSQPPGLYQSTKGPFARNLLTADAELTRAQWGDGISLVGPGGNSPLSLSGWFFAAAGIALLLDILAALWLAGRLRYAAVMLLSVAAVGLATGEKAQAQTTTDAEILQILDGVVLGYIRTGNTRQDRLSEAGMIGLSQVLSRRTSIEPLDPVAINLDQDELSVFPFIYWPILPDAHRPSEAAYARLNAYIQRGGMILFDTRDAHLRAGPGQTAETKRLQEIARGLNIPALAPLPKDHVLTRSFYLLQEFPGRHPGPPPWVEAPPPDAGVAPEGMPFRNLNDGVTPVVIGGNDWAAAWAVGNNGRPLLPVGRGYAGERQREIANRFGINLIMHVLTGNYKSDQVHVPALLDRMGQ